MPAAFPSVSLKQNRVLAEESGVRGNAGDRERGDKHGRVGPLDFLAETAHLGHFLLAAHSMNHRTSGKEEQRLEERVGHQMENARCESAYAAGEKHVAELADGGVGENFLNVCLHQTDGRGEKCCCA